MATFVMQCLGCEVAAMNTVNFSKSYVCYACLEVALDSAFVFCRRLDARCRRNRRSGMVGLVQLELCLVQERQCSKAAREQLHCGQVDAGRGQHL